jgi:hypothetical protein
VDRPVCNLAFWTTTGRSETLSDASARPLLSIAHIFVVSPADWYVLQVSWVRHRDIHLLTVGRYTYTSDQRFRAIHHPHSDEWTLQVKYPQHRDTGIYECQISTTPHMSHFIHLNVVGEYPPGMSC